MWGKELKAEEEHEQVYEKDAQVIWGKERERENLPFNGEEVVFSTNGAERKGYPHAIE